MGNDSMIEQVTTLRFLATPAFYEKGLGVWGQERRDSGGGGVCSERSVSGKERMEQGTSQPEAWRWTEPASGTDCGHYCNMTTADIP